jgi:hypothetical protein
MHSDQLSLAAEPRFKPHLQGPNELIDDEWAAIRS